MAAVDRRVEFDLLAMSRHRVRLLDVTGSRAVDVAGLPASMSEALQLDDREPQLHSHSGTRYLHLVDRATADHRAGSSRSLVLAGVDELLAAYRKVTRCSNVLDEVEPAAIAAAAGQVASVFVTDDREYWGRYRPGHRVLEERDTREPADHDLADVVASETLCHGGMAFVVPASEIPGAGTAAATLRYWHWYTSAMSPARVALISDGSDRRSTRGSRENRRAGPR